MEQETNDIDYDIQNTPSIVMKRKTGLHIDIPLKMIPAEVQAGDVVIIENGKARIDRSQTMERKDYMNQLANDLLEP